MGPLGGIFVGLIAPRIFNEYLELPIGILGSMMLALGCSTASLPNEFFESEQPLRRRTAVAVLLPDASRGIMCGYEISTAPCR